MQTKPKDRRYCGVSIEKVYESSPKLSYLTAAHLLEFITERYKIHIKKDILHQEAPWTDNPILQEYKFTNVRREHDRQTKYLINGIVNNNNLTLEDKICNICLFRTWNNWDTVKLLGGPWTAATIYDEDSIKQQARKLYFNTPDRLSRLWYSSAFIQGGTKQALREDRNHKIENIMALRPFHVGRQLKSLDLYTNLMNTNNQFEAFQCIKQVRGFSDFLAYQIFVDMTYIPEFPYSENEFVVAGPGCKRGLDKLFLDRDGMTYEECLFWLRDNIDKVFKKTQKKGLTEIDWNPEILFSDLPEEDRYMNVMSLENCFCELSKYIRAIKGEGRPRNHYKPYEEE